MLVERLNMNTSRPSLKYLQRRMCVVIAVDPTLGCAPPEVRPLLGDVFFLRFTIVWVIFTSRLSCDTTAISAGLVAVLSHPVQLSLLQIMCLRQLCERYTGRSAVTSESGFLSIAALHTGSSCLPASLSFTFSPHLFGITLITLLTIGAELLHSRYSNIAAILTFLMKRDSRSPYIACSTTLHPMNLERVAYIVCVTRTVACWLM